MPRTGPVKRLTRLKIREVSSVDRGAGEGVKVVLFKREFSQEERDRLAGGAAMEDGSFPIKTVADLKNAIRAVGRAKDPAKAKAHIIARARALGATDELPDDWVSKVLEKAFRACELTIGDDGRISHEEPLDKALADTLPDELKNQVRDAVDVFCKSCREIMASDEVDKDLLLEKSFGEFVDYLGKLAPAGTEKAVAATVFAALKAEEPDMDPKELEALKKRAEDGEKAAKELLAAQEKLAKAEAELAVAKLSAEERAFCADMSDKEKAAFAAKSPAERAAAMKKRDEDPVIKAMNERIEKAEQENKKLAKALADREEAETVAKFEKKAVDVYAQPKEFGATLRKAYNGDEAAQAEVEKVMESNRRLAEQGGLFKQFGGPGKPSADSARAEMAAKAEEARKADPKLTAEKAYAKVFEDPANNELAKRVRAEERAGA